jgi:protein-S-isoprenylcysteine O-methyltransferase Ste14
MGKPRKKDGDGMARKALLMFTAALVVIFLFLFVPAGTLDYWQAWIFMAVLFVPVIFVGTYLLKNDPEFLKRRFQFSERMKSQKRIIRISQIVFFIGLLVPGLDYRFGWSHVPVPLVLLADVLVFLGYVLVFLVFRENSYASRIIEISKGQKVISTGPYAVVRHPMYLGSILMYLSMPIALGSYVALLFFAPVIFAILFFRIGDEEKLLRKSLKGYKEYCKKVRFRLLPGIW